MLETARPMSDMESLARATLATINPNLSVVKFQTFDAQVSDRFTEDRMIGRLTMLFGALALVLAAVGLYGVTAYTVARRTSEIGPHGAGRRARRRGGDGDARSDDPDDVGAGALGLVIGVPVALLCVRFVKAQLYDVTGADASVLASAILTLAVAACVAGLIPARRAASVEPQAALRHE